MSLDVYLESEEKNEYCPYCGELSKKQYFNSNITHNLNKMADKAGLYEACWRPYQLSKNYTAFDNYEDEMKFEENEIIYAHQIIGDVEKGFNLLKQNPKYYKKYNAENGWGDYDNFVSWVCEYLQALKDYPNAIVRVSR